MTFRNTLIAFFALSAGTLVLPHEAAARVTEPDGKTQVPVPQSESTDYFDDSGRYTEKTIGLQSLFDYRSEAIDSLEDAATQPAVFSPLCGLQGSMLLRGGSCQVDFGWYCVDHPDKVHPLVTKQDIINYHDKLLDTFDQLLGPPPPPLNSWADYKNDDKGFVPTIQMPPLDGSAGLEDVRSSPDFSPENCPSQLIGFAVVGNPTSFCPQDKYSEQRLNQVCTLDACDGQPWVTMLSYPSTQVFGAFYITVEDLPTTPDSFSPSLKMLKSDVYPNMKEIKGDWDGQNDGDFNDFVYFVQGIQCVGGGQPCDTGKPGICSAGVRKCSPKEGVEGECVQQIQPDDGEVCDELDNDCDGQVDEESCPVGEICKDGNCIKGCHPTEFPCDGDLVCVTEGPEAGFCVDAKCAKVDCAAGQVCRSGECVGGCKDVVCPADEECVLGRCVDLCSSVTCDGNFVCRRGVCVSKCQCTGCPSGSVCATSGKCVDSGCESKTCDEGKYCRGGSCVDGCEGVVCPFGGTCKDGKCPQFDPANADAFPGGVVGDDSLTGDLKGTGGALVNPDQPSATGGSEVRTPGGGAVAGGKAKEPGCGCRTAGESRTGTGALALLVSLALGASRRRRPRSVHAR
jgi:MYXO-CTERM domain-containing protein